MNYLIENMMQQAGVTDEQLEKKTDNPHTIQPGAVMEVYDLCAGISDCELGEANQDTVRRE
ncbi:MAG: hypothetical protein MJ014_00850 [Methanocorpusculum sp.]|nr:hypothetical protein [Methanocorpusculum sp.]